MWYSPHLWQGQSTHYSNSIKLSFQADKRLDTSGFVDMPPSCCRLGLRKTQTIGLQGNSDNFYIIDFIKYELQPLLILRPFTRISNIVDHPILWVAHTINDHWYNALAWEEKVVWRSWIPKPYVVIIPLLNYFKLTAMCIWQDQWACLCWNMLSTIYIRTRLACCNSGRQREASD